MFWMSPEIIEKVKNVTAVPPGEQLFRILISGEMGSGSHELVEKILADYPKKYIILFRINLARTNFSATFFVSHILSHTVYGKGSFKKFLQSFTTEHQYYIRQKLELLPHHVGASYDWYLEIIFEYLARITPEITPFIIIENVDKSDPLQINKLESFLNQFSDYPIRVIYTYNPEGTFKHDIPVNRELILSKLSIHTVERMIQKYFDTTSLNARLITNHCYLKSGGNPAKIRLLLFSFYQPILNSGEQGYIDVKKMQPIKIPESWEDIFTSALRQMTGKIREVYSLILSLEEGINEKDLQKLDKKIQFGMKVCNDWLKSGLLHKISYGKEITYTSPEILFQKWQKTVYPLEILKEVLLIFADLQLSKSLENVYPLSDLLLDLGDAERAVRSAQIEAEYFYGKGRYDKAADRLYLVIRLMESSVVNSDNIHRLLRRLGDYYLHLESYENAFEIFKKLRNLYSESNNISGRKQWLEINLMMSRALVNMDAFQEARYLIRETRVKKFCDPATIGQCHELLGDIESNLGRVPKALSHYKQALEIYFEANFEMALSQIYLKLKSAMSDSPLQSGDLINKMIASIPDSKEVQDIKGLLLRDKIQILVGGKQYKKGLHVCHQLEQLLRLIYQPKIHVQLTFYYSEIYAQLGKWDSAVQHLSKLNEELYVIRRPELKVQTSIQLGMIYKEQALYGPSQKILKQALEICFRHGFHEYSNEIKLHLGHIHLLVHSLLRAYDFLNETLEWAEQHQKGDLYFLAKLYLAHYEIQHKKFKKARVLLSDAKKILNYSKNLIDHLNYVFYLALWLLAVQRFDHAARVANLLIEKSRDLPRYQASGFYLHGLINRHYKKDVESSKFFRKAIRVSLAWNFPQIRYLSLCELARQSLDNDQPSKYRKAFKTAGQYIYQMASNIEDDILSAQFLESKFHEDILKFCREQSLIKNII